MRALVMVLGIAVLALGAWVYRSGNPGPVVLGPADGFDLPATAIDRVAVGTEAPDFSLESYAGDVVTLSDYRGKQDVVLVFYRGHW